MQRSLQHETRAIKGIHRVDGDASAVTRRWLDGGGWAGCRGRWGGRIGGWSRCLHACSTISPPSSHRRGLYSQYSGMHSSHEHHPAYALATSRCLSGTVSIWPSPIGHMQWRIRALQQAGGSPRKALVRRYTNLGVVGGGRAGLWGRRLVGGLGRCLGRWAERQHARSLGWRLHLLHCCIGPLHMQHDSLCEMETSLFPMPTDVGTLLRPPPLVTALMRSSPVRRAWWRQLARGCHCWCLRAARAARPARQWLGTPLQA